MNPFVYILRKIPVMLLTSFIYSTPELRKEAWNQFNAHPHLIPGVYSFLPHQYIRALQAISEMYPKRSLRIFLDYILAAPKIVFLTLCLMVIAVGIMQMENTQ